MRRSFRSIRHFTKEAPKGSGKEAEKAVVAKEHYSKWFFKEVLLNPQMPRAVFLVFGTAAALAFYAKNGTLLTTKMLKKDEPEGGIKVESYSARLSKYATSMEIASNPNGIEYASAIRESFELKNQLGMNFNDVTRDQLLSIQAAQDKRNLSMKLYGLERNLLNITTRSKISKAITQKGSVPVDEGASPKAQTFTVVLSPEEDKLMAAIAHKETKADVDFWANILAVLTPEQRQRLTAQAAAGKVKGAGSLLPHAFASITQFLSPQARPHVFVLDFNGDVSATQVAGLKEEITAVVLNARPERGDKVVLRLASSGGTVTGYGLAAAQLARIKCANLELIVCVDEVAASGGYLMACVGDTIVASPFSMLGSIGVIVSVPNFSERMKREGVDFEDVTAGKYKRTMTPFTPITEEARTKVQSEISEILNSFKSYITVHRPSVNVDEVATGEVWLGPDALKIGLCDTLGVSDEILLRLRNGDGVTESGPRSLPAEIYFLKYEKKKLMPPPFSALFDVGLLSGEGGLDVATVARVLLQLLGGVGGGIGVGNGNCSNSFSDEMERNAAKRPEYYF